MIKIKLYVFIIRFLFKNILLNQNKISLIYTY